MVPQLTTSGKLKKGYLFVFGDNIENYMKNDLMPLITLPKEQEF